MFKRPIVVLLFLWIGGIVLAFNFIPPPFPFLLLAFFLLLPSLFLPHPLAKAFVLFSFFPFSVSFNSLYFSQRRLPSPCIGNGIAEGTIIEEMNFSKDGKPYLFLKAMKIRAGGKEDKGKIVKVLLKELKGNPLRMGEKAVFEGKLAPPPLKIRLQGISYFMKSAKLIRSEKGRGFLFLIGKLRKKLQEASKQLLPSDSSLVLTNLVIGKADVPSPPELVESFRKTGTIHILVVSGTQVSLLVAMVWFLLKWLGVRENHLGILFLRKEVRKKMGLGSKEEGFLLLRGLAFLFTFSLIIIGYSFLVGGELPIQRASLMGVLGVIAVTMGREMDALNIFAFTALAILLNHPPALYNPSFQLSFLAVWGLLSLLPIVRSFLPNPRHSLFRFLYLTFATSLSAQIAVSPILIYYFKMISPISLVANIFAVPLSFLILVEGLFLLPLSILLPFAKCIITPLLYLPINLLIRLVEFFSRLPLASLSFSLPPFLLYFSLFLLFLAGEVVIEPSSTKARKLFLYSFFLYTLLLIWHNIF